MKTEQEINDYINSLKELRDNGRGISITIDSNIKLLEWVLDKEVKS